MGRGCLPQTWTRDGKSLLELETDLHPPSISELTQGPLFAAEQWVLPSRTAAGSGAGLAKTEVKTRGPQRRIHLPRAWKPHLQTRVQAAPSVHHQPAALSSGKRLLPPAFCWPALTKRLLLLAQGAGKGRGASLPGPTQKGTLGFGAPHSEVPGLQSEAPRSGEPPQLLQP